MVALISQVGCPTKSVNVAVNVPGLAAADVFEYFILLPAIFGVARGEWYGRKVISQYFWFESQSMI